MVIESQKKLPFKLHAKFGSIYSFAVYFGSSIYIGAVPEVVERYGVNIEVSSLALALYVFGCKYTALSLHCYSSC